MNTRKLDKFMDDMPLRGIPQADLTVAFDGKIVYRKYVGQDDPNRDICLVCSVSKVTTCVAALRLVEEGRLGLDDPVSKYLPAFEKLTVKQQGGDPVPAQNVMTVRHLFTMTAGLNYNLSTPPMTTVMEKNPHAGTVEVVNAIAASPLEYEPGTRYSYSLAHDVLAAVVEVVSGERFADYVQKNILTPLGMRDSGYHVPEELRPRIQQQYQWISGNGHCEKIETRNRYILTDMYDSGGAGLYTTSADQMKLLIALANGGTSPEGYRVLNPETVQLCEKNQLSDDVWRTFFGYRLYGYGWGLCGRVHVNPAMSLSRSSVGEFGWDGATGPYALVDRKKGLALYFGVHVYGCNPAYHHLHPYIRNLAYEAVFGEESV